MNFQILRLLLVSHAKFNFLNTGNHDLLFQETLKKLFPSWEAVDRHREVIVFSAGLMKDSTPLVQFTYEMQIERHPDSIDVDLSKTLYHESMVKLPDHPLHNQYINRYNHLEDYEKNRPRDVTRIYFPSRVYHKMREAVVLENHLSAATQTPNCTMYITWPGEVTRDMLLICNEISKQQPVTRLWMYGVDCADSSAPPSSEDDQSSIPESRGLFFTIRLCEESPPKIFCIWRLLAGAGVGVHESQTLGVSAA